MSFPLPRPPRYTQVVYNNAGEPEDPNIFLLFSTMRFSLSVSLLRIYLRRKDSSPRVLASPHVIIGQKQLIYIRRVSAVSTRGIRPRDSRRMRGEKNNIKSLKEILLLLANTLLCLYIKYVWPVISLCLNYTRFEPTKVQEQPVLD